MPWQQLVADVGGEIDPATGLPAYREVIVTVPRQSGKTTLVLGWEIQRALGWGSPQRIVYSAQSGSDARKKLVEDQFPILEPRRKDLGIRRLFRANGSEGVEFSNGSRIGLLAATADSGHGKTVDLAIKDELFADTDDRRDQTLIPAMATKAAAQILTTSTMGTDESVPLNRAVERGRRAVMDDARSGVAYFEWSADLDADPDDPATWRGCMPALGRTITERVVAHARQSLSEGEFRRAFLNQLTKVDDRVIPPARWAACCDDGVAPAGQLVFSVDVNPERSAASIVAADPWTVELVEHRPGVSWVVARAAELDGRHGPARWVVDARGPAGSLRDEMLAAGIEVHAVNAQEMVEACARFYDRVVDQKIQVRRHPKLDEAAAVVSKRSVGDAWAWARKHVAADISPLVAATLAAWAAGRPDAGRSVYEDRGLLVL